MGDFGLRWLWLVDLVVKFARTLIESLAAQDCGTDTDVKLKKAASKLLDPDTPVESIRDGL